jgi:mannose-6-phosphate isomerase-like protein (cupin superfamily)
VLGWSSVRIKLLADAGNTGGTMSVMRTILGPHTEAAKPHSHTRSAEMFYILEGQAEILTGNRVLTAGAGAHDWLPMSGLSEAVTAARRRHATGLILYLV